MKQHILGFIGGGNMASSLIGGLRSDGYPPENIWVSDIDKTKLDDLAYRFGIRTTTDNFMVAEQASIVILAVKPPFMKQVVIELAETIQARKPVLISIAAGITETALDTWAGGGASIVRTMPNTPALVKAGATALHANAKTTTEQRSRAEAILRSVGLTVWVEDESLLNAVTALSGSGPAYLFMLMEAMEEAGVEMGLDRSTARLLSQQTALGAGRIAIESEEPPAELRRRVTSPGGTTERAIAVFEKGQFTGLVGEAMRAAAERAAELSQQLGA